jgi:hypothetical protein
MVNFVPEGGIWMNTQRPEWNDANNALVGKGLSVVTLCYLRRTILFCKELFLESGLKTVPVNIDVQRFCSQVSEILHQFSPILQTSFNDQQRRQMVDLLGSAGSRYRWHFYQDGLSNEVTSTAVDEIIAFLDLAQRFIEHSIQANGRSDHLYHTYNTLHLHEGCAAVDHLYEMLEGQVAVLSSGLLSERESLACSSLFATAHCTGRISTATFFIPTASCIVSLRKTASPGSKQRRLTFLLYCSRRTTHP